MQILLNYERVEKNSILNDEWISHTPTYKLYIYLMKKHDYQIFSQEYAICTKFLTNFQFFCKKAEKFMGTKNWCNFGANQVWTGENWCNALNSHLALIWYLEIWKIFKISMFLEVFSTLRVIFSTKTTKNHVLPENGWEICAFFCKRVNKG